MLDHHCYWTRQTECRWTRCWLTMKDPSRQATKIPPRVCCAGRKTKLVKSRPRKDMTSRSEICDNLVSCMQTTAGRASLTTFRRLSLRVLSFKPRTFQIRKFNLSIDQETTDQTRGTERRKKTTQNTVIELAATRACLSSGTSQPKRAERAATWSQPRRWL